MFILHRNSEAGLTEPRFRCDRCGSLIANAAKALLLWDDDFKGDTRDISPRLVCKKCDSRGGQELPLSMELDTAIIFLLNNSGMTPQRIKEQARIAGLLSSI